jgi:alpha-tubulin suppressor-like RCC1 family protein
MVGVGNTTSYSSPVQIGALTTWASATTGSTGTYKTVAIKTDGTLWAWGWRTNHTGGTGAGGSDVPYSNVVSQPAGGPVSIDVSSPVQIGAATNWATTASGLVHSLAITTGGALYAWGSQEQGQLGVGTLNNNPDYYYPQPDTSQGSSAYCQGPNYSFYETPATDSTTGVLAYDSGQTICSASYVLWTFVSANTVAWGHSSPVQVGALTTWSKVAAGFYHSASVKTDGTLWAWGLNGNGQIGNGVTTNMSSPVQIGALTTWANVSCGGYFTLAVKTDGTLWAWGVNSSGELGLGNTTNRSSPVQVGTATNWLSTGFSAGNSHTLAIRS